jgi:Glycosyl hydrolase family 67 N-terminus
LKRIALFTILAAFLAGYFSSAQLHAENGAEAWLRYARLDAKASQQYENVPSNVVVFGDSAILNSSREELIRRISGTLGKTLRLENQLPQEPAIVLGTISAMQIVPLGAPCSRFVFHASTSPHQLKSKLNLPRTRRRGRDHSRCWRRSARRSGIHHRIRGIEACVVEKIENLGAKLQI